MKSTNTTPERLSKRPDARLGVGVGQDVEQHPSPQGAEVSLTFDDGPDPGWTPRVLEALGRADARATFFVVTPRARENPRLISRMRRDGHRVEFHCVRHVRHTELTHRQAKLDVETGLRDLGALGIYPRLWRTPWGILAPWTTRLAEDFGLRIASWTADTHDWRGDTAAEMLGAVTPLLKPGAVVLLHDGLGPGALRRGCEETVTLIEPMAERIRDLGCVPAPMRPAVEPTGFPEEASA